MDVELTDQYELLRQPFAIVPGFTIPAGGYRFQNLATRYSDHLVVMRDGRIAQSGTPLEQPLINWTTARFANEPEPAGCIRKSF